MCLGDWCLLQGSLVQQLRMPEREHQGELRNPISTRKHRCLPEVEQHGADAPKAPGIAFT